MDHFELTSDISKERPWQILSRYLENSSFPATSYKSRNFYEKLLIDTSTCEIKHTTKEDNRNNIKFHHYSKIHIKKIITAEEWGLSTFREKSFTNPENNTIVRYNYWDYVDALHKVFLYQNPGKKHSWFIKIASAVNNPKLPNWFFNWWKSYGPSVQILIEPFKEFYVEWTNLCPKLFDTITHKSDDIKEIVPSLLFFTEFSIPWIWKWEPEIDFSEKQLPQLQRAFYTKFWINMLKKDPTSGQYNSQDTIDFIQESLLKYKDNSKIKQKQKMQEIAPLTPLQIIEAQLVAKGIENPSQGEIMEAYMVQMQHDLLQFSQSQERSEKSDTSMGSISENQYQCLAGESQDPNAEEELDIPGIFDIIKTLIPKLEENKEKKEKQEDKDK